MTARPPGGSAATTLAGDVTGPSGSNAIASGAVTAAKLASGAVILTKINSAIIDPASGAGLRSLGTGSAQAAAGNHAHAFNDISDVNTAGAVSGTSVLGFVAGNWVPVPGGAGAVTLDDLTDVDVAGAPDGSFLGKVAGVWTDTTLPGGPTNFDDLADVNAPAPADGAVATWSASSAQWVALPGAAGAVTWMETPESHGAFGNAAQNHTGVSATAGTSVLTWNPGGVTNAMIGMQIYWRSAGATAERAQIGSRVGTSSTQVNLVQPGTSTPYVVGTTVTNTPGCRFWDDTAALQATITAAKASKAQIGLKPNSRYGITADIDCSNFFGLRIEGLGGGPFSNNTAAPQAGGSFIFGCATTAITMLRCGNNGGDPANDQIQHGGAHITRVGFSDPSERQVHTAILTQFQTRSRIEKCYGVNLFRFCQNNSGVKDASWGTWSSNATSACKTHYYLYNAVPDFQSAPTGAMAIALRDIQMQIQAGDTGIDWFGGQYGEVQGGKWDQDGVGSTALRVRGGVAYPLHGTGLGADNTTNYAAGTSPAGGKLAVSNVRMEATGNTMDATSVVFDVWGGAGQITFANCFIGGGGTITGSLGGTGYQIGVNGAGTLDDVVIQGGSTINRNICAIFGQFARSARFLGHGFGGNGKFIRYDTGSVGCGFSQCRFDLGTDPTQNTAKIDAANGTRVWWEWVHWNNGFAETAQFASIAAIPSNYGTTGSRAYITTAGATEGMVQKKSTGWVLL